ncbi:TPA: hypothetical protein ACNFPO_004452 [Citrobacter freundii]
MISRQFALGLLLLTFSSVSLAVDGYKNVKFGSSFKQLQNANFCNWKRYDEKKIPGLDSYYCENFQFGSERTMAMAFFINGQFKRFGIVFDSDVSAVLNGLQKKYGEPSSTFDANKMDELKAYGGSASIGFDKDTVVVTLTRDPTTKQDSTQLIYTAQDYEKLYGALKSKNLEGDL